MTEILHERCPICHADAPPGGRFCIECGALLSRPAATGATERLPDAPEGAICRECGIVNPGHATYCVNCGRALAPERAAAPRPAVAAPQPTPPAASYAPRPAASVDIPQLALPTIPDPLAIPPQRRSARTASRQWRYGRAHGQSPLGLIIPIGIVFLIATDHIWPGILILIGIVVALESARKGRLAQGLIPLVWLLGLALLIPSGLIWPGVLVLIGLTIFINSFLHRP